MRGLIHDVVHSKITHDDLMEMAGIKYELLESNHGKNQQKRRRRKKLKEEEEAAKKAKADLEAPPHRAA